VFMSFMRMPARSTALKRSFFVLKVT
jgi:hypothetical protein